MIERLAPADLLEEIKGDLYEMYLLDAKKVGDRRAGSIYVRRAIGFLVKNFFWKRPTQRRHNMTGSYFKMARRSLLANKGTAAINIFGLVIGIASALAIISVISFELSFDTFHSDYDNIYRMVRISGPDKTEFRGGISYPVAPALKELSSIKKIVDVEYLGGDVIVDVLSSDGKFERQFFEDKAMAAIEPEFFDMFDYAGRPVKWISGSPAVSLKEQRSLVLTRSIGKKYFGDEDPVGRTLRFQKVFDFKITGVIDDLPVNTDLPFGLLVSYSTMQLIAKDMINDWVGVNDGHTVYIRLQDGATKEEVEEQIARIHAAHVDKDLAATREYRLQPLSEVHFDARFGNFSRRTISHETILALQLIVLCLLGIGCINYVNLATAQSTLRTKEIGMRKVMGSSQRSLIMQFLVETFVTVSMAGLLAMVIVFLFMPSITNLLGLRMNISPFDPLLWMSMIGIVLIVTICAGLYPAQLISRFNPIVAIKSQFNTGRIGGVNLRKALVVLQFTAVQILAVATFMVVLQMEFFRNVDMGFDRSATIITIRAFSEDPTLKSSFENETRKLPFVKNVSKSFTLPSGVVRNRSSRNIGKPDASSLPDFRSFEHCAIDENFLDLYGIKLLAGRNLTPLDSERNILVNEALMRDLGYQTPRGIVGVQLKRGDGMMVNVVGVINDYYGNSLKERADNVAMNALARDYRQFSIKLDLSAGQDLTNALTELERTWKSIYPEQAFHFRFFDENISMFYEQEAKYSKLFQIFSAMFIGIGCLGLYGLITFIANRKGKEIAIRKTLGASVGNIIVMFSREYAALIVLSFAIAVPIAWYGVSEWLSNFSNQIDVQWWLFALPGLIVLLIALTVVCAKSFNAAMANPVEKLKTE